MRRDFSPQREPGHSPGRLVACFMALLLVAGCATPAVSESEVEVERLTRERKALLAAAEQAAEKAQAADTVAGILAHDAAAITDPAERAAAEERASRAAADAAAARAEETAAYEAAAEVQARIEDMQND